MKESTENELVAGSDVDITGSESRTGLGIRRRYSRSGALGNDMERSRDQQPREPCDVKRICYRSKSQQA